MTDKKSKNKDEPAKVLPIYSIEEVNKHNTPKDCWIILFGRIYDVTPFLEGHPGGPEFFLEPGSRDLSESFEEVGHFQNFSILTMLRSFLIGKVDPKDLQKPSL